MSSGPAFRRFVRPLLLVAALLSAAPAQALDAVALDAAGRFACTRDGSSSFVTWKRALGANRNRSVSAAAQMLGARAARLADRIGELSAMPPDPVTEAKIQRLERKRQHLLEVAGRLADCESGAVFVGAAEPSFAFLCRFGFTAPSVATRHQCSVNLRAALDDASGTIDAKSWDLDAVAGILDELLAEACARSEGILLRNMSLSDAAPLYSAWCAHDNRRVATDVGHDTLVLGMEEEPTGDCILTRFLAAKADDPCGGWKRPPGGGGGGTPPPPPDSGDCLIQRMEEEPTGCE